MEKTIEKTLNNFVLSNPMEIGNLTFFSITNPNYSPQVFLSSIHAHQNKLLSITEVDDSGVVNKLTAISTADIPILITEGEELIGAKQNRIVNVSILLAPNSKTLIPVNCSESGRWSYRKTSGFTPSDSKAEHTVRSEINSAYAQTLKDQEGNKKKYAENIIANQWSVNASQKTQRRAWDKIRMVMDSEGVHSGSSALHDIHKSRQDKRDQLHKRVPITKGQLGLLVCKNSQPYLLEYIENEQAYSEMHAGILNSLAVVLRFKTNQKYIKITKKKCLEWISKFRELEEVKKPGISLGENFFYSAIHQSGNALLYESQLIHLSIHETPDEEENISFRKFSW